MRIPNKAQPNTAAAAPTTSNAITIAITTDVSTLTSLLLYGGDVTTLGFATQVRTRERVVFFFIQYFGKAIAFPAVDIRQEF